MLTKVKAVIIIIATIQNIIFGFTTPTVKIYYNNLVILNIKSEVKYNICI